MKQQYAVSVGIEEAVVQAEINPHQASDATYYVQYGPAACPESEWEEGCLEKPLAPGALLTGEEVNKPVPTAGVLLGGLNPASTYYFRFVAQSSLGGPVYGEGEGECPLDPHCGEGAAFTTFPALGAAKSDCPNQALRIGPSAPLPDCRAFEMVSPVDKNGGEIKAFGAVLEQSAVGGGGFAYAAEPAFADPQGAPINSRYLAWRGAGGWSNESLSPPRGVKSVCDNFHCSLQSEFKAFSPDLCQSRLVHITDPPLAAGAAEGYVNLYRRSNCAPDAGSYEATSTGLLEAVNPSQYWPELQGTASDGGCAVFRTEGKLTEDAPGGEEVFRLYEKCGSQPRFLCRLPDGTASGEDCSAGTSRDPSSNGTFNSVAGAVSSDGSRVFWSASVSGGVPGTVYLRANAREAQSAVAGGQCTEAAKACTYPVSGLVSGGPAQFWAGDPEGERALFSIGETLYEFAAEEEAGGGLHTEATPLAGGFQGLMGASSDLSRAYLVSTDALDGEAQAGEPNLYLDEEGAFTYIATLAGEDVPEANGNDASPMSPVPSWHLARVTPDGGALAFMSRGSLSGYENSDRASGEADGEVYLYEAGEGKLLCASCNPGGARPVGREVSFIEAKPYPAAAQVPAWSTQLYQPRYLSDDGSRLFFESFEALLPRDTNGRADVYEWERAASKKACEEGIGGELYLAADGGCLSLISSGQSAQDSRFLDADPSGASVFINTGQSLLPQDPGLLDVYVAREGGGFAPPSGPAAECEGEACQSPPGAPNAATPASAAFRGAGNTVPARDCSSLARRLRRLAHHNRAVRVRGRALARRAHRAGDSAHGRRLARRAHRLSKASRRRAKAARRLAGRAKRCRRANRRAAR